LDLKEKILSKKAHLGVIGMGYVGLPLMVEYAKAGFRVSGLDKVKERVDEMLAGRSYIGDVLSWELKELVQAGLLNATIDPAMLAEVDTVNICVPTPLRKTKDPDVSYIVDAVEQIALHLHPGQLVILESTTYPGTTEELILPRLESTGLKVGKDFYLAFSPERVDPGNPRFTTKNIPKVVGGVTPACCEMAVLLYQRSLETVVPVSNTVVAEMVKLLENTFRSVNIGLVNELALMCDKMGIDVWEVIDAAATKPFGFMPFYPGPGLGGHCIPIDPFYLSWKAKQSGFEPRFIELAGQINGQMPQHVVSIVARALNNDSKSLKGSKILVLGVAYKRDIDDCRESPALDVIQDLAHLGARVEYSDPYVPSIDIDGQRYENKPLSSDMLSHYDCVLIATDHSKVDYEAVVNHAKCIVDTRNVLRLRGRRHERIYKL
jgi:UDP-N-acetyl-D-glucosamine dehydrogenase